MAQRLNIQRAIEDRILDPRSIERAMEEPAIGVPADDAILQRIVGGDGFGSLARVVGDVDGRVVARFDGGLLGHALGSVAACHRRGKFGVVGYVWVCGLCGGGFQRGVKGMGVGWGGSLLQIEVFCGWERKVVVGRGRG